jgi:chemotaxis signal transduction protein
MVDEPRLALDRAAALRSQFDTSFSLPRQQPAGDLIALILVCMGQQISALPLAALSSFGTCGPVLPLPGQSRECLGVIGHKNRIIPVFQLSLLLQVPDPAPTSAWIAISHEGIGFVVSGFNGQIQVQRSAITCESANGSGSYARSAEHNYPIIDLPSLSIPILAASRSTGTSSLEP